MLIQTAQGNAPDGLPFQVFTLTNSHGMSIQMMDWGATWMSCKVPVKNQLREVLLGCRLEDYLIQQAYLGAIVGRYANRIAYGQFKLNGKSFQLNLNQEPHQLHGGLKGFDRQRWQLVKSGQNFVSFMLHSADGDQGFPGNLDAIVTYKLAENNSVEIEFEAKADQDTPLNLTNHAYFNLNDADYGSDIRHHHLQLNAEYYLPVDSSGIPNASLKPVQQTSFDFRQTKQIVQDFLQDEQMLVKGYDHAFLLGEQKEEMSAILTAQDGSLSLRVSTSQPVLQVYTGNFLAGTPNRFAGVYADYAGIALETQALPDTPNHPEWWALGGIIQANKNYHHWTKFQFL
ncbi:galactose-1-epimerase [Pasteurella canis]|uniref:galactose-1-epimerase n=1 Tax=Pasteurella canis TaxID=753 RepID=UPI001E408EEB|nr:galactose-1-epimerase [Pasteurella canis]UEA17016.1 galactose-1-epimerase [Pasteurella canis]